MRFAKPGAGSYCLCSHARACPLVPLYSGSEGWSLPHSVWGKRRTAKNRAIEVAFK